MQADADVDVPLLENEKGKLSLPPLPVSGRGRGLGLLSGRCASSAPNSHSRQHHPGDFCAYSLFVYPEGSGEALLNSGVAIIFASKLIVYFRPLFLIGSK